MQRIALDENELAIRWGLSVKTLRRWRQEQLGPVFCKLGAWSPTPGSGRSLRAPRFALLDFTVRTSEGDGHERSDHLPADIAEMSVSQLAALPPAISKPRGRQEPRRRHRLAQEGTHQVRCGAGSVLRRAGPPRCVNPAVTSVPPTSTMARCIKFELPKKVSWNQSHPGRNRRAHRAASGEKVEGYLDVKLSVSESRYTNWPRRCSSSSGCAHSRIPASRLSPDARWGP